MTVTFTAGNNAVSVAPIDLITSAFYEINALAAGETPSAEDGAWGLEKLQRLIDRFNAMREIIFSANFNLFTLIPNHSPHTIGPTGDFATPIRPTKILSASFVLNGGSSNPVDLPVFIRDDEWWAANPLKSLTSSVVTDLYYSPDAVNGSLYFYPISNVAFPVRLEYWSSLAQAINLTTKLGFVQGYWDAIVLSLAIDLFPSYPAAGPAVYQILRENQKAAMMAIFGNNDGPPRIDTNSGMPGTSNSGRPDFNFLTGMRE